MSYSAKITQAACQTLTGGGEGVWGRAGESFFPVPLPLPDHLPNLVLVGTVHGDPAGYARAWRLLSHFQPGFITVEISPFSVRYRRKHEGRWRRLLWQALAQLPPSARGHLAIRRLQAQVEMPFELRAARDWGEAYRVPWRPLDLEGPARRHLPRYETELLNLENLHALSATEDVSLEDWVAGEYRRARGDWRRAPWRVGPQEDEARRREAFQARRLRHLTSGGVRILHLGGWEHLAPWRDGSGLTAALADLRPLALLLADADGLGTTAMDLPEPGLDAAAISC